MRCLDFPCSKSALRRDRSPLFFEAGPERKVVAEPATGNIRLADRLLGTGDVVVQGIPQMISAEHDLARAVA